MLFYAFRLYRVPTVGGKPLDLHRLFVEVTSRGGLEKVWLLFYLFIFLYVVSFYMQYIKSRKTQCHNNVQ